MIKNLLSNLLYLIPRQIRYEICRHHVNKEYAENHSDFTSNGELWLLEDILPGAKTVFDVGSFSGEWASHALNINPKIELHCFEPSQRSFQMMEKRGFRNNVVCNPFGLGSKNCQTTFFAYDELSEGNSLFQRRGIEKIVGREMKSKTEMVEIRTLDSYCKEKEVIAIDFIKIDVEGNEFAVIEGGKKMFENECVRMAQFEYGGTYIDSGALLRDFFDFFSETNYLIFLLYPKELRLISHYDQRLENFCYKNFIVVNNEAAKYIKVFQNCLPVF